MMGGYPPCDFPMARRMIGYSEFNAVEALKYFIIPKGKGLALRYWPEIKKIIRNIIDSEDDQLMANDVILIDKPKRVSDLSYRYFILPYLSSIFDGPHYDLKSLFDKSIDDLIVYLDE